MISPDLLGQTLRCSKQADVSFRGCNHRVYRVRERKTKKGGWETNTSWPHSKKKRSQGSA